MNHAAGEQISMFRSPGMSAVRAAVDCPDAWGRIDFKVTLPPRAQERARDRIVTTKDGKVFNQKYKSSKQQVYETQLGAFIYQHKPEAPLNGPIVLHIRAFMEVPKSRPKKVHAAAVRGEIRPEGKPDVSNVLKNFEDVANGILFKDDAQIVEATIGKFYGSPARWEITVFYRKDCQG